MKVVGPNVKSAGSRLAAGHTAFCTNSKVGRLPPTRSTHSFPFLRPEQGRPLRFRLGPGRRVKSRPAPFAR